MRAGELVRTIGSAAVVVLATGCEQPRTVVDLPEPLRQEIANPICERPLIPSYGIVLPDCPVPGDACDGFTLVVEVTAQGRPGAAHVEGQHSEALDACMTAGVRGWRFLPARDCGGMAVAAVWKGSYSAICDELIDRSPPAGVLATPVTTLPLAQ
jgi:hypothetical protein